MYHGKPSFFNYDNYPAQAHNTCGQAVIASILDHSGKDPYQIGRAATSPADTQDHFPPEAILSEIIRDFGPNWLVKNTLTVRSQIKRALHAFELEYREVAHKPFRSAAQAREQLEAHLRQSQPSIVLIDTHSLKMGRRFTLHWCIAFGYDEESIAIATWGKNIRVPWDDFMSAWRCWFVTYPYNYYQIQVTL